MILLDPWHLKLECGPKSDKCEQNSFADYSAAAIL